MIDLTPRERDVLRSVIMRDIREKERSIARAKGEPGDPAHDTFVNRLNGMVGDRRSIMRKLGLEA
jgi:hypothetical protein